MQHPALTDQQSADLFLQLARLELAGLPILQSIPTLQLPTVLKARRAAMVRLLGNGATLADAGLRAGLFSALDATVLRAACQAGSPAVTLQRLSARHAQRARNAAQIRSRSAMPVIVLLIALAVQPLPALVAGSLSGTGYVLSILRPFLFLGLLVLLGRFLKARIFAMTSPATPIQRMLTSMMTGIPVAGRLAIRGSLRDFTETLALLLEAGVPMLDALPQATATVRVCTLREVLERLHPAVERGATLADALASQSFPGQRELHSMVVSGEASGTLAGLLLHWSVAESEAVAQSQNLLAEWLPRLFYAGVAGWMAWQILHSHIMTVPV